MYLSTNRRDLKSNYCSIISKSSFHYFLKILSALELGGLSTSLLNKCLTLDGGPNRVENLPGIAYALRSSLQLEKLVMKLKLDEVNFVTRNEFIDYTSNCKL